MDEDTARVVALDLGVGLAACLAAFVRAQAIAGGPDPATVRAYAHTILGETETPVARVVLEAFAVMMGTGNA